MPRIQIDVSQEWLSRLQRVLPAAIDALSGWEYFIDTVTINGDHQADDALQMLRGQIHDLRRSIETVRIIF